MNERLVLFLLVVSTVSAFPRADQQSARARARSFPAQQIITEDQQNGSSDSASDICSLPAVNPSPIACLGAFPKWTFNAKTEICEQIIYGGCGGTKNLFSNEYECLAKCNRNALLRSNAPLTNETESSPCLLPKVEGKCRAQILSFYFDSTSGGCASFIYTGCGGNANNFMSLEDCQQMCREHIASPAIKVETLPALVAPLPKENEQLTKQELCSLPPVNPSPFRCLAFIPSWTYNTTSGRCESYIYGGCGKTANLFVSEETCKATCETSKARKVQQREDSCLLPIASGPCFGHALRYAFIKEKNRCEIFTFGGCQGNKNNFRSANECFEACGGNLPSTTPECEQTTCPVSNRRYIERGCLPEYKDNACCPTSFSCPEEPTTGICHYRGVSYKVGDVIMQISEDNPCKTRCECVKSDAHLNGAKIECAQIFCDEPYLPPGKTDCVLVSPFDSCCPHYKCSDDQATTEKVDASNATCNVNNKEYKIDQYIRSGEPCKTCRCVEGFNGLNEQSCREIHCVVDNRIGCVPVYVDGVCCPISYKCSENTNSSRIIHAEITLGKQGVSTLPIQITPDDSGKSPFISVQPEASKQGVSTLPIKISEDSSNSRIISVKPETGKQGVSTLPIRITDDSPKDPRCLLPKQTGPCRMAMDVFYYDNERNECQSFIYGGCKGNSNRFETAEECNSVCRTESSQPRGLVNPSSDPIINSIPEECTMSSETGPCRGSVPSFFYNSEKGECESFWYGGCKGNANRFETLEKCQSRCFNPSRALRTKGAVEEDRSHCQLRADMGPCRGAKERYYYDSATGECKEFIYGGCRGNKNNFHTIEECQNQCRTIGMATATILRSPARIIETQTQPQEEKNFKCTLPADPGFCRGHTERYFYDSQSHVCKTFTWGGCAGNANNFHTEQDCMSACHQQVQPVTFGGKGARLMGARVHTIELSLNNEVDVSQKDITKNKNVECLFGNLTLHLGDILLSEDPCEDCVCSTPPEISCSRKTCPTPPNLEEAVCQTHSVIGQCCPNYTCVSANPPFIDVCAGVECKESEYCKVEPQETTDGSWAPPKGVCTEKSSCAEGETECLLEGGVLDNLFKE